MFLKTVKLKDEFVPNTANYPFSIPSLAQLNELSFEHAVTFFVGENGSGKSTLLEGLADQIG
ncbi:MAG: AAA family ATPase, partial [Enterococcus sp.]